MPKQPSTAGTAEVHPPNHRVGARRAGGGEAWRIFLGNHLSLTLSNYAAEQSAAMKRSHNVRGMFIMSVSYWDMEQWR